VTKSGRNGTPSRLRPPAPHWLLPEAADPDVLDALVAALRLPRAVCAVLAGRGITEPDEAKVFLRPRMDQLHDAGLLADGRKAAARIAVAIRSGETLLVHGDYDVDGICATALLTRWLTHLGGSVVPFVPHRLKDGYDFGPSGLAAARQAGATLIVTADCGTVAHAIVEQAVGEGIDVVVTDHHTVAGGLPAALAVVNPQRPDCSYPDKGLCGTGVAYKLCDLVGREMGTPPDVLDQYLDLVALATVADLVPLRGENRVLVHFGLRRFATSRVLGLQALTAVAGVTNSEVTAGKLGFVVAPRINAAGRIGDSADALRLLLTDDAEEARVLAQQLDAINRARQDEDKRTLAEALDLLDQTFDPERDFGVVLACEGWHPGVIGIVASRIVERVHRPVVLIALDGDKGRGSARSIPGFDLYKALAACSEHMGRFGGHKQAAGMDVRRENVTELRQAFNEAARSSLEPELLRPKIRADLELHLGDVDLQLVHWLDYLGPHGMGNPGPVFVAHEVRVEGARLVGSDHLKATLAQGSARVEAIGFGLAAAHDPATVHESDYDVIYRLERNEWKGRSRLQARLLSLRRSAGAGGSPA
jgi:single-stranded-DNA-specific exonuclease